MTPLEKITALEKESKSFGFYWPNADMIIDKIKSELDEIQSALHLNEGHDRVQEEVGDLLHAAFALCTYLDFNTEETLINTTCKYEKRLKALKELARKKGLHTLKGQSVENMVSLWNEAKKNLSA